MYFLQAKIHKLKYFRVMVTVFAVPNSVTFNIQSKFPWL